MAALSRKHSPILAQEWSRQQDRALKATRMLSCERLRAFFGIRNQGCLTGSAHHGILPIAVVAVIRTHLECSPRCSRHKASATKEDNRP